MNFMDQKVFFTLLPLLSHLCKTVWLSSTSSETFEATLRIRQHIRSCIKQYGISPSMGYQSHLSR